MQVSIKRRTEDTSVFLINAVSILHSTQCKSNTVYRHFLMIRIYVRISVLKMFPNTPAMQQQLGNSVNTQLREYTPENMNSTRHVTGGEQKGPVSQSGSIQLHFRSHRAPEGPAAAPDPEVDSSFRGISPGRCRWRTCGRGCAGRAG